MVDSNSFIRPDEFWHSLMLRAGQTVVHLGSGAGFYVFSAAKIVGKSGKVFAVDIRPDMLAQVENKAREAGLGAIVKVIRTNIEEMDPVSIPPACADVVLVANILHQSDPRIIVQQARRIVSASGRVVIVIWSLGATPMGPPAEKRLSPQQVQALAEAEGLVFTTSFSPSTYHTGLVFDVKKVS